MKKFKISLWALTFCLLIISCKEAEVINEPQSASLEERIADMDTRTALFNSHFGFASIAKSFSPSHFDSEYLEHLDPDDVFVQRTKINFPDGFTDQYGNEYSGSMVISYSTEEKETGTIHLYDLEGMTMNDISFSGKMITYYGEIDETGRATSVGWCSGCPGKSMAYLESIQDYPGIEEPLKYHMPNGAIVSMTGGYGKRFHSNTEHALDGITLIEFGDGEEIEFFIDEPFIMGDACRWFTSGKFHYFLNGEKISCDYSTSCDENFDVKVNDQEYKTVSKYHDFWD